MSIPALLSLAFVVASQPTEAWRPVYLMPDRVAAIEAGSIRTDGAASTARMILVSREPVPIQGVVSDFIEMQIHIRCDPVQFRLGGASGRSLGGGVDWTEDQLMEWGDIEANSPFHGAALALCSDRWVDTPPATSADQLVAAARAIWK